MSPTITDETRRRLALGLYCAPRLRNRRRNHRRRQITALVLSIGGAFTAAAGSIILIAWFITATCA